MNNTLVQMKALFTTDGNWDDKRRRFVRERMDADKILNADDLTSAIEFFKAHAHYVDEIEDFEFFLIDGKRYNSDFWKS